MRLLETSLMILLGQDSTTGHMTRLVSLYEVEAKQANANGIK